MKFYFFLLFGVICIPSIAQFSGTNQVMNNGEMRFGNGTELSINAIGNLRQPFYFSDNLSVWRKLTYSESALVNYPLDSKISVGGDGTNNWNLNGTDQTNPVMNNQVFDSSNFSIVGGIGSGTLRVRGEITVGTARFELTNSYSIGLNQNFVEVVTTFRNIGPTSVQNIRYWIGTRDDYVGATDSPTKVRGNIVDDAFVPLNLVSQRASALRITTLTEGILFFTTASRGNNIHSNCALCGGGSPLENPSTDQDPSTNPITSTNDGSYSMFVRINDLNVNETDTFVWYYAAAPLAELDDVIEDVADSSRERDWDLDGILNENDLCPYAYGFPELDGCPWSVFVGNNYKSSTISNTVVVDDETYYCDLTANGFFNAAFHSGENQEPAVGDFIIWNRNYAFPHPLLYEQNGFAFMKLRDYDKIIEVRKSDGLIVAEYPCP